MKLLGIICLLLTTLFLAWETCICWLLRDGLGPDAIASAGFLAWSRFAQEYDLPLLLSLLTYAFGAWCLLRKPRAT